jgi:hypothetical protein
MRNGDPFVLGKTTAQALLVAAVYSLPALVAVQRQHDRSEAIALANLLLGWTVLGWLLLLVWALKGWPQRWSWFLRRSPRRATRSAD